MNLKQKLTYMLIGCLFTLAGFVVSNLFNATTQAQDKKKTVFDKIVCKELEIVNDKKKTVAVLYSSIIGGGSLIIYNHEGNRSAQLIADEFIGGVLKIHNTDGDLCTYLNQGRLSIHNAASLGSSLIGGHGMLEIRNKDGKELVIISPIDGRPNDGLINIYNHKGEWRSFSAD
ncbi:hypothetical protein F4X73_10265 [Candidatus Poribacteria bacterium]|nr:hypothetical protein [Candidatus Poribacteria bacterium]